MRVIVVAVESVPVKLLALMPTPTHACHERAK
jgi:hypothetical protein